MEFPSQLDKHKPFLHWPTAILYYTILKKLPLISSQSSSLLYFPCLFNFPKVEAHQFQKIMVCSVYVYIIWLIMMTLVFYWSENWNVWNRVNLEVNMKMIIASGRGGSVHFCRRVSFVNARFMPVLTGANVICFVWTVRTEHSVPSASISTKTIELFRYPINQ